MFHAYNDIISFENLLVSWGEFLNGKRKRQDVAEFSLNFMDNIVLLHDDLKNKTYIHGGYEAFRINDPKPREIHKASVRDRLLHHAIYRVLYPYFDRKFIYDSYSCRIDKGTHKAMNRFRDFGLKVSKNKTRTVWILKCDIRKFFANIDHQILKDILAVYIGDLDVLWLLSQIIDSFETGDKVGVGLPLGNLTSQLLVNIYMNEFDQSVKRELKVRYYIRYADDFVLFSENKAELENLLLKIDEFLKDKLELELHPDKVYIKTLASGVDFLGWVHFADHRVLRKSTKRRIFRRVIDNPKNETCQSYLGILEHGNARKIEKELIRVFEEVER
ncbi:MAG: reverse transcriptase/maturase family protein [Candidatus Berkelbacteria bacterium]